MNYKMHILIVDDDATNRFVLGTMLKKFGHTSCSASDGYEAIEQYKLEKPDIVLMDVMMPGMDGLEATKQIKGLIGDEEYVPVIFLTALSDEQAMAKCVESGGDDFLTKPYKKDLLAAKLKAHIRLRILHDTTKRQRDELRAHNDKEHQEQLFARNVYQNIIHQVELKRPNIKYSMSSMALFNGDVLLAAQTPMGKLHVMLGDFTGHGLSAAIGAVPLSSIFYTMTAKGFAISDIISEINVKLKNLLPLGIFCAACIIELDYSGRTLKAWNGGIPAAFLINKNGISQTITSNNPPLGILPPENFKSAEVLFELGENDKIILCTDGVTEANNHNGEMFGTERLKKTLTDNFSDSFDKIISDLNTFTGESEQTDDITLIEVQTDSEFEQKNITNNNTKTKTDIRNNKSDWDMCLEMDISTIKEVDPIPLINQFIIDLSCKSSCKHDIFLILSELITNSIDHGILQLDSALKSEEDGFLRYYERRKEILESLSSGLVKVHIKNESNNNNGKLTINIQDSGNGFDHSGLPKKLENNLNPSGRGIPLINKLCQSVIYKGNGNEVEAIYNW